jgi:hypothetical protein
MKCLACDKVLNDYEATRKNSTGDYVDLCNGCIAQTTDDTYSTHRIDLESEADVSELKCLTGLSELIQ